jgi:hypothetical protein
MLEPEATLGVLNQNLSNQQPKETNTKDKQNKQGCGWEGFSIIECSNSAVDDAQTSR